MTKDHKDLFEKVKRFQRHTSHPVRVESRSDATPSQPHLPDALLRIPGVMKATQLHVVKEKREAEKDAFLASLGVRRITSPAGEYGYRETISPPEPLLQPHEITFPELNLMSRTLLPPGLSPHDILFIDTETTGLAGGAGTVPFLIGVGYFQDDAFHVGQFFLRDYPDEAATLADFAQLLRRFRAVATYNGKKFDVPILRTRFLLNRLDSSLLELPHLDLLHTARRLWRDLFEDCRLATIESGVLGRQRKDDIPGEQIPYVYFDFVRGRRLSRMKPVFQHNVEDIVTLARLAVRVCRLVRRPLLECEAPRELFGIARCLEQDGRWEEALQLLSHARTMNHGSPLVHFRIRQRLSLLLKRLARWDEAVVLWREMETLEMGIFPCVELAKYYEQQERRLDLALQFTENAIAWLSHLDPLAPLRSPRLMERLHYRQQRLQRKITSHR